MPPVQHLQPASLAERLERAFEVTRDQHKTIPAMAGLRGMAVLLVFATHYVSQFEPWMSSHGTMFQVGAAIADIGDTGVDLFFVLSGYLIYGALLRSHQPLTAFFERRVRRIYPAFGCVLLLYVALALLFPDQGKLPADLSAKALYVLQNALLLPGIFPITPLMTVAWSLSYEAFYYLAVPLIVFGLRLGTMSARGRMIVILALTCIGFAVTTPTEYLRLMMFPAGMLLFDITADARPWHSDRPWGLIALAVVIICVPWLTISNASPAWRSLLLFVGLGVLCLDSLHWQTLTGTLFSAAPLRWLGNMSYSYYLLHGLTLKFCFMVLRSWTPAFEHVEFWFVALMPVMWLATLGPTFALFALVEKRYSFAPASRRREARPLAPVGAVVGS